MPAAAKTVDGDRVRDRGHSGTIAGRILIVTALATVTFEGVDFRAKAPIDRRIGQTSRARVQINLYYFIFCTLSAKKNTPLSVAAASKPVFAMATAVRRCLFRRRRLEFGHRQTSLLLMVGWSVVSLQTPGQSPVVAPHVVVTRCAIVVVVTCTPKHNKTATKRLLPFTFGSFALLLLLLFFF